MVLARPMVKRPMRSRSRPMPIIANSSGTSSTAFSTWVAHEDRHQRDIRNQDGERADERDDPERQIEGPGLGVRIVNSRFDARVLAYRVGSRERQYGGGQKRGPDQADGEQCRRRGAGQRLQCHCGVSGVVDGTAVAVQRRRTRHHDEEADDARKHGARDHVDPLEGEVLGSKLLVDRVGLDEREPPRGERGADGGSDDSDGRAVGWQARHQHAVERGSPVRIRQHSGRDVGQEHRRQQQQESLDAVKAATQYE